MKKSLIIILSVFFSAAYPIYAQDREMTENLLALIEEGSTYMAQGFQAQRSDSTAANVYFRKAIEKFLSAFRLDTTNIPMGSYLPELYFNICKFDSALQWGNAILIRDSINGYTNVAVDYSSTLEIVGLCHLYMGNIDLAESFLFRSLKVNKYNANELVGALDRSSDTFYFATKKEAIAYLPRNINACNYSIEILRLAIKMASGNSMPNDNISTKIQERAKNCR